MGADEADLPKGDEKAAASQANARRRGKAPVTIDLQAESVSAEPLSEREADYETASEIPVAEPSPQADAPKAENAGSSTARPKTAGLIMPIAAGVAGGLVVLALGFGLQAAGILPTPGRDTAVEALAATGGLSTSLTSLDQRLMAIEAASAQTIADRALLDDLAKRVGVADAFGTSLGDRILTLEASVAALGKDDAGTVTPQMLDDLGARVARLEANPMSSTAPAGSAVEPAADAAAFARRIAGIETKLAGLEAIAAEIATLTARLDAIEGRPATVRPADETASAEAFNALRHAAASGRNFGAALAVVGTFGLGATQIAALAPLAEKDVPSRDALAAAFPEVMDKIFAAGGEADAGVVGRLLSYGRSLVRVRPTDAVPGEDPTAITSRIQAALQAGNLAAAHEEWEKLPAEERDVSGEWAAQLADRIAIDRLVDELALALGASAGSG